MRFTKRRSKRVGGGSSLRSYRSTASNNSSSSVSTVRGILKYSPSRANDHGSASSGGSRSTSRSLANQSGVSLVSEGQASFSHPRKVSFANVAVREYERCLGDNPSCSSGAPIGLGWAYAQQQPVAVDEFEQRRARRVQPDLVLTRQSREELLVEWGASFQDIIESIRVNIRIKNQRRSTVNAIGRYDRWEEMMENAGRKIKKTIGLQKQVVTEESPQFQQYQQHQHRSESPQRPVSVPKKPVRRVSVDSPKGGASAHGRHVSRELLEAVAQVPIFDDFGDQVDQEKAPSLIGSSLVDSEISHADGPERPGISAEVSRLSFDSKRPTALIELDQMDALADDDGNGSVYSAHSGITMSEHGGHYSVAGESCSTDGFGELERDTSHWAVGGMDCPILLRRYHPTVICEDGTYDDVAPSMDNWQFQGFGMQPPPFSNAMVSRWK